MLKCSNFKLKKTNTKKNYTLTLSRVLGVERVADHFCRSVEVKWNPWIIYLVDYECWDYTAKTQGCLDWSGCFHAYFQRCPKMVIIATCNTLKDAKETADLQN